MCSGKAKINLVSSEDDLRLACQLELCIGHFAERVKIAGIASAHELIGGFKHFEQQVTSSGVSVFVRVHMVDYRIDSMNSILKILREMTPA